MLRYWALVLTESLEVTQEDLFHTCHLHFVAILQKTVKSIWYITVLHCVLSRSVTKSSASSRHQFSSHKEFYRPLVLVKQSEVIDLSHESITIWANAVKRRYYVARRCKRNPRCQMPSWVRYFSSCLAMVTEWGLKTWLFAGIRHSQSSYHGFKSCSAPKRPLKALSLILNYGFETAKMYWILCCKTRTWDLLGCSTSLSVP